MAVVFFALLVSVLYALGYAALAFIFVVLCMSLGFRVAYWAFSS